MKKFIGLMICAIVVASGFMFTSVKAVAECPQGQELVNGVCQQIPSGTPLYLILASYCKPGQIKYSEWSECDKRFGKNGLQWRTIIRPTFNGCQPSVYDQLNAVRECLN